MAGRNFVQYHYSLEKKLVTIYANWDGNSTSTPTLLHWNGSSLVTAPSGGTRGVKSITRNGVGDLTITFQDNFQRLLSVDFVALAKDGSTTPAACNLWVKAVSPGASGGATLNVVTYLNAAGTPADSTTNDRWYLAVVWSDSQAF
ncbi:MAG TPA: hypothetical protein VIU40_08275 [Geobacteraceae bacterium]